MADRKRKHEDTVKELKKYCFDTPKLREWCFAQDNGANPQMKPTRGFTPIILTRCSLIISAICLGSVGDGQEFFRRLYRQRPDGKEIPVRMTNFAAVLNDPVWQL